MRWMMFWAGLLASSTGWAQEAEDAGAKPETVEETSTTQDGSQSPAEPESASEPEPEAKPEPESKTAEAVQTLGDMMIKVETVGEGESVLLRLTGVAGDARAVGLGAFTLGKGSKRDKLDRPKGTCIVASGTRTEIIDVAESGDLQIGFKLVDYMKSYCGRDTHRLFKDVSEDGYIYRVVVSPRGLVKEEHYALPDDAPWEVKAAIEVATAPLRMLALPEEPVAAGAKWTATSDIELDRIKVTRVAEYEVVRIVNGIASVSVVISHTAERQVVKKWVGYDAQIEDFAAAHGAPLGLGRGLPIVVGKVQLRQQVLANIYGDSLMTEELQVFEPRM